METMVLPKPITGKEIPLALYARLRRNLQCIYIVSPFLEDYKFFNRSPVSSFLLKHLAAGTSVQILTTPPGDPPSSKRAFVMKYRLLNSLNTRGIDIQVNSKLHAKIFLFEEPAITKTTIVGSANLTVPAMNERLEIALLSFNHKLYERILIITKKFLHHHDTTSFIQWKVAESKKIRRMLGGSP